ncbi:MAG: hypothetical protein ABL993_14040 [Vicinamibacterales bacterium]
MPHDHPLILGLFDDSASAAAAARGLRALGVPREGVSIVARSHDEEGELAKASGSSPGSEIEDSRTASRLGELGAHLIAAVAIVLPGIGPIVADGPLAAGLGEAAGHLAGGVARTLERAGLPAETAAEWESRIHDGAVLTGAHVTAAQASAAKDVLARSGAVRVVEGHWRDA